MAAKKALSVAIPASAVTGTAVDISDMTSCTLQIIGSGTATLQIMQSVDGTNFLKLGSDVTVGGTAATSQAIGDAMKAVRIDCSSFTTNVSMVAAIGGLKQIYN